LAFSALRDRASVRRFATHMWMCPGAGQRGLAQRLDHACEFAARKRVRMWVVAHVPGRRGASAGHMLMT
jgi:hypothetical protein